MFVIKMSTDADNASQYHVADDSAKLEDVHQQIYQKTSSDTGKDSIMKSTNDDVQRAIEGLKDIPDEELQEFLDDEDFMEGLDVVDAWEGDEERNREADPKIRAKEGDQRRLSRERRRERKSSYSRERPKREERKREEIRRDPTKSTKDIERDKIRTKRDTESKLLAEKEKAIKHLLDSDDVVPPGTEAEAIQSITEKQNLERAQLRIRKSRERRKSLDRHKGSPLRRRSSDRSRLSPHRRRSPLMLSPERRRSPFKMSIERHRSPFRLSPEKRRSPGRFNIDRRSPFVLSPERRRSPLRRLSWDRRSSADRRWSVERHRRRQDMHERRRSRSRDRQRSRSMDRFRRRLSRSPINRRFSPRRRSRSRSRSPDRRARKRSPFINELARQLRNEAMMPPHVNTGYQPSPNMEGIPPLMTVPMYQQDPESRPPLLPPPFLTQSGPAIPPQSPPPPPPPPPPPSAGVPMPNSMSQFLNFEIPPQTIPFESMPLHTLPPPDYSSGPVMYNQQNPGQMQPVLRPSLLPAPVPSPQPVPAPLPIDHGSLSYSSSHGVSSAQRSPPRHHEALSKPTSSASSSASFLHNYRDYKSSTTHNGSQSSQKERLKTPEPPVISNSKQFEKTSLSSLLEASVSAKDSTGLPVLYPGFKPEILRHCEHALRELPLEDPRLKMKGRFFFDPTREDVKSEHEDLSSNSILLQKGKSRIYWQEEEEMHMSIIKPNVQMHQKICQTDETETDSKSVQATVTMVDRDVQVYPHDLQQANKEEKKPIMDRLDWNMRETFDYTVKYREADDLRWSLSNSSQKRSWGRGGLTPPRRTDDHERRIDPVSSADHSSRNLKIESPHRSRDNFPGHKAPVRDHYGRERYSPGYRHSAEEHDDFPENRSDRSRGESPMVLDDSADEIEPEHTFQRGPDWHGRGKSLRGKSNTLPRIHFPVRGKHIGGGRPYRGRGNFRAKF